MNTSIVHGCKEISSCWIDSCSKSSRNHHPRKQFNKDLIRFINDWRRLNLDIILNLDANEALGEESQGIILKLQTNSKTPTEEETAAALTLCWEHNVSKHVYNAAGPLSTMMK
jgi:hypothetical protein